MPMYCDTKQERNLQKQKIQHKPYFSFKQTYHPMQKILFFLSLFSLSSFQYRESNQPTNMNQVKDKHGIQLSLAEWSFHKALFDKNMDHLGFISKAGAMGFEGVEYVNQFFKDKAQDLAYLDQMTATAKKAGVKQLLIMIDGEGYLADLNSR